MAPRLIDPSIARAVAKRVAGDGGMDGSYLLDRLRRDLGEAVGRSEELVAEASGIGAPPPVAWDVIDRATWAEVNIASMSTLLAPIADKIGERMKTVPFPVRIAQRSLLSAEVGVLLGYISRRVLGQYDLLVPENGPGSRRSVPLLFVGPNMVETERRLGLVPEDFALWVAVHEVTHRFQFAGVPWLRDYFLDLVRRYLDEVDLDARGLATRLSGAVGKLVRRETPAEERNPVYLLATDDQRVALDRIQSLMAVVEGHGNFVMDLVGSKVIPTSARMRALFRKRREQSGAVQRALGHVLGLEMKLRQYEVGQAFCDEVYRAGGTAALSRLWADPSELPTLEELREPGRWLLRVA
jgi:coenzyme F420 biosynthesis associated uncharacterized protein